MKIIVPFLLTFLLINSIFAQSTEGFAPKELIVKFKKNVEYSLDTKRPSGSRFNIITLDELNTAKGVNTIKPLAPDARGRNHASKSDRNRTYIIKFESNQNIPQLIKEYLATGLFRFVEPNYKGSAGGQQGSVLTEPIDEYYYRQWGLYNDGSFTIMLSEEDADIDMELAWDIEIGSSDVIVAVLDGGCKRDHPEFEGRIWTNTNEIPDNGIDDDQNGYIDDVEGWDFAYYDNDPDDQFGHGTNVTGIVGAKGNNSIGYAGVDWNCQLMICKILEDNNYGYYSVWTEAIYYAVDQGAKVINMSVGGSGYSSTMEDAINYAHDNGVTVVACMHNQNTSSPYYPAAYENTIAVGSTNPNDQRTAPFSWSITSGSNFGNHIDVVAPGNYIYGLHYQDENYYDSYWGGTSQATPLVTGLASLLLAQDNTRTPDDIREIINTTAQDQVGLSSEDTQGWDQYYGYGRMNAHHALLQNSAPVIVDQSFSTEENSANGAIIGTIAATDRDGDILTYTLVGDNTEEPFSISENDGVITVNSSSLLDFETNPTFTLTVLVDDGVLQEEANITVQLEDLDEQIIAAINDGINEKNIIIYPNPASTNQEIIVHLTEFGNSVNVSLYNLQGEQLYSQKANPISNEKVLNILLKNNLNAGVYLLEIADQENQMVEKLIIK